jgi:uncharacterized protein YggE
MTMKAIKVPAAILSLTCFLGSAALAEPELRGTPAELAGVLTNVPKTVRITGEGQVKLQADRAILTVKVTTTARELGKALKANEQVRTKFTDSLTAQGLPAGAVQAAKFSSTEKYAVFSDKVRSHTVQNLLKVTVHNEKEFQLVAEATDALPEAQYLGVEFERSDKEEAQARAVAKACDHADLERKVFEDKLGLKLRPVRVSDPAADAALLRNAPQFAAGTAPSFNGVLTDPAFRVVTRALEQRPADETGFGEITFKAVVIVEYRVDQ